MENSKNDEELVLVIGDKYALKTEPLKCFNLLGFVTNTLLKQKPQLRKNNVTEGYLICQYPKMKRKFYCDQTEVEKYRFPTPLAPSMTDYSTKK